MAQVFVGRTKELQHINEFYESVVNKLPHKSNLLLVEGEAGLGKSTLIKHFIETIQNQHESNILIASTSCEIYSKEASFLPFFQILDRLRTHKGFLSRINSLEKFNKVIGEVAPSWLKMLPFAGAAIADTLGTIRTIQQESYKNNSFLPSQRLDMDVYGQFLKILLKLEENKSILIFIDDLQWADEETIRLFMYLARRIPESNSRIVLIGAYRPYDLQKENKILQDSILDLEKKSQAIRIKLLSFTIDDLSILIKGLYGLKDFDVTSEILNKLILHTAGNPLFLTELFKYFEENNKILLVNENWKFDDLSDISNTLPESLEAALEQRIENLEKKLRDLLTIASIEGENFTAEVLSKIKNIEITEILNALVEDLSKTYKLVRESGEIEIAINKFASLYVFQHGLIRDYIYNRLSPSQKRIMHQQVGDCLESLYGEKDYLVAHQLSNHFLIAKDYFKLAKYGVIVAKQEYEKYSPKQALWWSKTVIDSINHIGSHETIASEALLIAIQSHVHLGQNDDALTEIEKLQNVSSISDVQFGVSEYLKGEVLCRKGRFEEAKDALLRALSIFNRENELILRGWSLRRLGHVFAVTGNFEKAENFWFDGLKPLEKLQDAASIEVTGTLWSEIAEFSVDAGDMKKAELANQNALALFQKINDKRGEAIALGNLGGIEYMYGNLVKSEAFTRRSLDIYREVEDGINIISGLDNLARTLIEKGNLEEAHKILAETEPIAIEMNEVGFLPEIYMHLSEIALLRKQYEVSIQYALRATEIVAEDDQYSGPRAYCFAGRALYAGGRFNEAEKFMKMAMEMVKDTSFYYVKGLVMFSYAQFLAIQEGPKIDIKRLCVEAKHIFRKVGAQRDLEKVLVLEQSLHVFEE